LFDLRVLYAEDEDAIRSIFSRVLSKLVKELFVAADGEEALELYKIHQPDIIITDIRMPKMTGFEMASVVRSENSIIPIVATTAHNDAEHFLEAIRLGVTSFLVKPIDTAELVRTLESVNNTVMLQKENKQKTVQLEEALIKAKLAEKAKGDFLAAMSHEIRTPLNAVLGFTELLRDVDNKTLKDEYLSIIESNGKNLLSIINDILDYSKIESGSFEIEKCEFVPIAEFEPVVDLFGIKAYEKKIELITFIDPNLPKTILGDPLRIRQILSNLLSNAIKFTPESKNIFVNIVPVESDGKNIKILFEVIDEGIGVASEKLERIFTPFSQADAGISRRFGGSGLGLSISANLASMMGGKLAVESKEGVGSRFWFELDFEIIAAADESSFDGEVAYISGAESCGFVCDTLVKYLRAMGVAMTDDKNEATLFFSYQTPFEEDGVKRKVLITKDPFLYGDEKVLKIIRLPLLATKIKKALLGSEENTDVHIKIATIEGGQKEVLVADDNKINQKLISAVLKKHGFETVIANDGEEAVELFLLKHYQLVLLDIQMPRMDGVEAMKIIKQIEGNSKIVALTANANSGDRERFLREGFDGYLQKPMDEKELLAVLNDCFFPKKIDYFSALEESLGLERSDIAELLRDFVFESASELVMMQDAYERGDLKELFELAHKTKGAASNLRLEEIRKIAFEIEQKAKESISQFDYEGMIARLKKEIENINFEES
jgi:signal transduction histidine kinase/HPt (histidine-containing phosphotransfer) domain-containing protein